MASEEVESTGVDNRNVRQQKGQRAKDRRVPENPSLFVGCPETEKHRPEHRRPWRERSKALAMLQEASLPLSLVFIFRIKLGQEVW